MHLHPVVEMPGLAIGYDSDNQWLYADWHGEHTQESSRKACMLMLESLRAWPCSKILNDNSSITHTSAELSEWGVWWLDEMQRAGLEHIAWVFSHHFTARQASEGRLQLISRPVVGTFDDVASACVWLQQQAARS